MNGTRKEQDHSGTGGDVYIAEENLARLCICEMKSLRFSGQQRYGKCLRFDEIDLSCYRGHLRAYDRN